MTQNCFSNPGWVVWMNPPGSEIIHYTSPNKELHAWTIRINQALNWVTSFAWIALPITSPGPALNEQLNRSFISTSDLNAFIWK